MEEKFIMLYAIDPDGNEYEIHGITNSRDEAKKFANSDKFLRPSVFSLNQPLNFSWPAH